jgi:hypothetical protein
MTVPCVGIAEATKERVFNPIIMPVTVIMVPTPPNIEPKIRKNIVSPFISSENSYNYCQVKYR